jgi:hypothetical protein
MYKEFLLALIYLIVIFAVNMFLLKLIKDYFFRIYFLFHLKNILINFFIFNQSQKKEDFKNSLNFIFFKYFLFKNSENNLTLLEKNINLSTYKDILVIGSYYKYVLFEIQPKLFRKEKYYFSLIEKQYLCKN